MRLLGVIFVLFTPALGIFTVAVVQPKTPQSVAVVLIDLTNTVTPLANRLLYATHENATQATVKPTIDDINTAVTGAVSSLKLLVGQPTNVVMASVDGSSLLSPSDIAALLAAIVNLIFEAANAALSVVDSTTFSVIQTLLATLGQLVFSLLSIVLSLVAGLLVPLLALLAPVFSIISSLGLTVLLNELLGGLL